MAEMGIDHSKLPGVKEVCRDFAILEDHTLAHTLQEQEIEHHLATNIQRNRLAQGDLQVAKQLQEEENRRAHSRLQDWHKDREQQDCEIAQEIQVRLVIEAEEQRRRQEEVDEDIARILQQKELREEKRKKKPTPPVEALRRSPYEEGYCQDGREEISGGPRGQVPKPVRPRPPRQPWDHRRGPPLVLGDLDLEVLGSSSEVSKARDGQRHHREKREKKTGRRDQPQRPPLETGEGEDVLGGSREYRERTAGSSDRSWGSASLILDEEEVHGLRGGGGRHERQPRSRERPLRSPPLLLDWDTEQHARRHREHLGSRSPSSEKSLRPPSLERRDGASRSPNPGSHRLPREQHQSPLASRDPCIQDSEASHRPGRKRDEQREWEGAGPAARASPSSHLKGDWEMDRGHRRTAGTKSKGTQEATYQRPGVAGTDLALHDAEVARKMQADELLEAGHMDRRAAQVSQDEEIARLLMAEEKAAYRRAKEREMSSLDKRRQDQGWKRDMHKLGPPWSREGPEGPRHRSDKPARPPPPVSEDLGQLGSLGGPKILAHHSSKAESSQKGYHYKQ